MSAIVSRRTTDKESGSAFVESDPALQFLQTVWKLEHALERASKRMEDEIGISGPQRFALRMIGQRPAITAGELASVLHLHPSTVTGIVQRLETRKLVKRTTNENDGRVAHLHLTAAGAKVNAPAAKGTIERAARTTLGRVSDAQRKAAAALMAEFTEELMKL